MVIIWYVAEHLGHKKKKSLNHYTVDYCMLCGGVWVGIRFLLDWNKEIFYYCVSLTLKFQSLNHGICMKCRAGLFAIQIFPYPAWPASVLMEVVLLWMKELQKWACHVRSPSTLADETFFSMIATLHDASCCIHCCYLCWSVSLVKVWTGMDFKIERVLCGMLIMAEDQSLCFFSNG